MAQMTPAPPTGEREGALDLDELERLLKKGAKRPWAHIYDADWYYDEIHRDDEALILFLVNNAAALLTLARQPPSEKQSPAAPAQPGEGEPSADEWAKAMRTLVDAVDVEVKDMERQSPALPWTAEALAVLDAMKVARALLERRGGPLPSESK